MLTNAINLNPGIVFMGEDQRVCIGENVTVVSLSHQTTQSKGV